MALPDPDAQLTRDQLAGALTEAGFPITKTTLATKASRGGGPPFRKWGRRPIHRWGDALAWARSRLGPTVTSSSETDVIGRAGAGAEARLGTNDNGVPKPLPQALTTSFRTSLTSDPNTERRND